MVFPKIEGAFAKLAFNNEGREDDVKFNILFPEGRLLLKRWADAIYPDNVEGNGWYFLVKYGNRESLFDSNGTAIAEGWDWIYPFHQGIALVRKDSECNMVRTGSEYNFMRLDGTLLLKENVPLAIGFEETLNGAYWDKNRRRHVIDRNGVEVEQ